MSRTSGNVIVAVGPDGDVAGHVGVTPEHDAEHVVGANHVVGGQRHARWRSDGGGRASLRLRGRRRAAGGRAGTRRRRRRPEPGQPWAPPRGRLPGNPSPNAGSHMRIYHSCVRGRARACHGGPSARHLIQRVTPAQKNKKRFLAGAHGDGVGLLAGRPRETRVGRRDDRRPAADVDVGVGSTGVVRRPSATGGDRRGAAAHAEIEVARRPRARPSASTGLVWSAKPPISALSASTLMMRGRPVEIS